MPEGALYILRVSCSHTEHRPQEGHMSAEKPEENTEHQFEQAKRATTPYSWLREMHDPDFEATTDNRGKKAHMDDIVYRSY